jgi:hypothetical protein
MLPAAFATPVLMEIAPDAPSTALPELTATAPLIVEAEAVKMATPPLEVCPAPEMTCMSPPDAVAEPPATSWTFLPAPEPLSPALTTTAPLPRLSESPVVIETEPVNDPAELPVITATFPLSFSPALVKMDTEPVEPPSDRPLWMLTDPPSAPKLPAELPAVRESAPG